jgi:hypothetical protein
VWKYWGLNEEQARRGGLNPKMFNSFLDGSKPAIESTAVANATGLTPAPDGLAFPPCSVEDLPFVMRPISEGGQLHHKGQVEVASSLEKDGRAIPYEIRKGVWVVFEAATEYQKNCFEEYMLQTDPSGRYSVMYKRWHLIGLEVGMSVASIGLRKEPTGARRSASTPTSVATAKRDLKPGEMLDGEGGYTVYGKLFPSEKSTGLGSLPLGLAHNVKLVKPIKAGQSLTYADVVMDESLTAVKLRREMERDFAPAATKIAGAVIEGSKKTAVQRKGRSSAAPLPQFRAALLGYRRSRLLYLVVRHRLQRVLGPVGLDAQVLAVALHHDVAPLNRDILGSHSKEAANRNHHGLDGAVGADEDLFDLAYRLVGLVLDVRADQGIARHIAVGVEVAAAARRCGGSGLRIGRRTCRHVGASAVILPDAGIVEDLPAVRRVGVLVLGFCLQLVLGEIDGDLLPVLGDIEFAPVQANLALAHAQEAADADHDAVDVAVLADEDRLDLTDRLVLSILDVAANQLACVGAGLGRHRLHGGRTDGRRGRGRLGRGGG